MLAQGFSTRSPLVSLNLSNNDITSTGSKYLELVLPSV